MPTSNSAYFRFFCMNREFSQLRRSQ
jgi:hypothetical protein